MYTTPGAGYGQQFFSSRRIETQAYKSPQQEKAEIQAAKISEIVEELVNAELDILDEVITHRTKLYEESREVYLKAVEEALESLTLINPEAIKDAPTHIENAVDILESAIDALTGVISKNRSSFKREFKHAEEISQTSLQDKELTAEECFTIEQVLNGKLAPIKQGVKSMELDNHEALSLYSQRGQEALNSLRRIDTNIINKPLFYSEGALRQALQLAIGLTDTAKAALTLLLQELEPPVEVPLLPPLKQADESTTSDSGNESEGSTLTSSPTGSSSALSKMV